MTVSLRWKFLWHLQAAHSRASTVPSSPPAMNSPQPSVACPPRLAAWFLRHSRYLQLVAAVERGGIALADLRAVSGGLAAAPEDCSAAASEEHPASAPVLPRGSSTADRAGPTVPAGRSAVALVGPAPVTSLPRGGVPDPASSAGITGPSAEPAPPPTLFCIPRFESLRQSKREHR